MCADSTRCFRTFWPYDVRYWSRPRSLIISGWMSVMPTSATASSPARRICSSTSRERAFVDLLDACRMDPPVPDELLERHPRRLAPHGVEAREHHGLGRIVDDQVDAGRRLERADVPSLAADDAALHVLAGKGEHRDGRLRRLLGRDPLDRDRHDLASALLALLASTLLDLADLRSWPPAWRRRRPARRAAPGPRSAVMPAIRSSCARCCSAASRAAPRTTGASRRAPAGRGVFGFDRRSRVRRSVSAAGCGSPDREISSRRARTSSSASRRIVADSSRASWMARTRVASASRSASNSALWARASMLCASDAAIVFRIRNPAAIPTARATMPTTTGTIVPPTHVERVVGEEPRKVPPSSGAGVREGGRSASADGDARPTVLRSSVLMSVNSLTGPRGMTSGSSFVLLVFTMLRPREHGGRLNAVFRRDPRGRRLGHASRPVGPPQGGIPV